MRSTVFPFMLQNKYFILKGEILFTYEVIFVARFRRADRMCKYLDVYCFFFCFSLFKKYVEPR